MVRGNKNPLGIIALAEIPQGSNKFASRVPFVAE
jgi:hypothetical protein